MTVPAGSVRATLPATITERAFAVKVVALAHIYGWHAAHFRPARTEHGWRTAVGFDGAGFPDLVLVHSTRGLLWFRELKVGRNKLTTEQESWRDWLTGAVANFDVWRPEQWADIVSALSFGMALVI